MVGRALECFEIVHVLPEERDATDGRRGQAAGQVGERVLLTLGHLVEREQVGLERGQRVGGVTERDSMSRARPPDRNADGCG